MSRPVFYDRVFNVATFIVMVAVAILFGMCVLFPD